MVSKSIDRLLSLLLSMAKKRKNKKKYSPELGQGVFGQPWQEYECPEYVLAFLDYIANELDTMMWNKYQKQYASPFKNTGNKFKDSVFEAEAYSWNEDVAQPYNFKWKDIRISWYKYCGRGTTINKKISYKKAIQMFDACVKSIDEEKEKHFRELGLRGLVK